MMDLVDCTINGDTYIPDTRIIDFFVANLHGINVNDVWFEQDGAILHTLMKILPKKKQILSN